MQARAIVFSLVLIAVLLLIDWYCFKGLKLISAGWEKQALKKWTYRAYWFLAIGLYCAIIMGMLSGEALKDYRNYKYFYGLFGVIILFLIPKLVFTVFHLTDDITNGIAYLINKAGSNNTTDFGRRKFITQIGAVAATVPFVSIGYGIVKGRYNFRVIRQKIAFKNLPEKFNGFKIVQFSDMHIGSFYGNKEPIVRAIAMMNELKPDLILFTGDFVNNYAAELDGWQDTFSKLEAPFGKFSVLGNHDYGDYVQWGSIEEKKRNLNKLLAVQKEMGFEVLLNSTSTIEKAGQSIKILGIENWGKGGFSKYGDLKKAMETTVDSDFQVLLSHDPSHWDEEVLRKTKIDLALAGHTHGMQFGVEAAGIKWSPVKWRYPRWAGLYQEAEQYLYINRGLGYIGFPGRVGIWPEITEITLRSLT